MLEQHRDEAAIIYRFSRKDTENLARRLSSHGIRALPYHAGLDAEVRKLTQERFVRDEVAVIVATIAFGMGIDKPDVRLIVHYDMPKSVEGYYQETGRAGRDDLPSDCVFFYSRADKIKHEFFIKQIEDPRERENARRKLDQVVELGELETCRRRYLLAYFGEEQDAENCSACDICLESRNVDEPAVADGPKNFDATEITQKILSAVARTGQRFGAGHVSQVLRGARTRRVLDLGHDRLSVLRYRLRLHRRGYQGDHRAAHGARAARKTGRRLPDSGNLGRRLALPQEPRDGDASRPSEAGSAPRGHESGVARLRP